MPYDALPGYETTIPTDRNKRIKDARDLLARGAKLALGVAVSEAASDSAHASLNAEITAQQKAGKLVGNFVLGPYALFDRGPEEPFAPIGLAVWELADNRA